MKRTLPWVAALMLAACSPALNWRSVPLDGAALTATLPCKPGHAVRTVEMVGLPVELAMAGCEADMHTFAISHAALPDLARADTALAHWRAAALARVGAATVLSSRHLDHRGRCHCRRRRALGSAGQRADPARHGAGVWFARVGPRCGSTTPWCTPPRPGLTWPTPFLPA
jgi:hypothetical protein